MGSDALENWTVDRMKTHLDKVGVDWFKTPPRVPLVDQVTDYLNASPEQWMVMTPEGLRTMTDAETRDLVEKVQASDPDRAAEVRRHLDPPVAAANPFADDLQTYLESRKVVPTAASDGLAGSMARHPAGKLRATPPLVTGQ